MYKVIGKNINSLRKAHGFTQVELSARARVNYRHYQNIEAGKIDCKLSTLKRITDVLGVPLHSILLDEKGQGPAVERPPMMV